MLTHRNLVDAALTSMPKPSIADKRSVAVSYCPVHVANAAMASDASGAWRRRQPLRSRSTPSRSNIRGNRPTFFVGVPRIY